MKKNLLSKCKSLFAIQSNKKNTTRFNGLLTLFIMVIGMGVSWGQTYYDMSIGNYSQNFNGITALPTNFSTVAVISTGSIPIATRTTTASSSSLSVVASGAAVGIDAATSTSLVFLTTGATDNSSSIATDLNLNFTSRTAGTLAYTASTIFNSSGNRVGSLRVYYSLDGTTWTELTGTNLPYVATNNVAGNGSVSISLPSALNNQATVKLRFYYHNGSGGNAGSRPRIGIDDLTVSSSPSISTTNYYSKSTGNLNEVANWGTNTDGTGTAPSDFTTAGQVFNIRNNATPTIGAAWTVSGSGSKIVIGDGTNACNFTIPADYAVTGTVDVSNAAELTIENTTPPTFGTFATNSTLEYNNVAVTLSTSITYRNLKLTGTGAKTFPGNTTTIAGNLILNGSSLNGAGGPTFSTILLGGNLTYVGTVTPPTDTNSITLSTNGTAAGTQTFTGAGNTLRWFRITTTTANTIVLSTSGGSSNVLLGNEAGGGLTLVNNSILNMNGNDFQLFSGSASFNLNTTGSISTTSNTDFNLERTTSGSLGTLRFTTGFNTIGNLTLNHTGATNTLTIGNALNVNGVITVTDGTLASGGNITLKSNAIGTAQVAAIGSGGSITGNVTVERYIPAKRAWRALTAPVSTTGSIYTNWQEGGTGNGVNGFDIWMPGGSNGLTAGGSSNSLLEYNSADNTWTGITTTNGSSSMMNSTKNKPFMAFVTGPYGSGNITSNTTATTLRATGSLLTGDQSYTTTTGKYTFIGNPYASPLDLSVMMNNSQNATASFEGNVWVWDANASGLNAVGTYNLYNSGTYTNLTSNTAVVAGTQIQSGQAFFVKSTDGATFTIKESHKGTTFSNAVFRNNNPAELLRVGLYKQENTEWSGRDGAMTVILPDANANQTPNKMANGTENVAFVKNGSLFASEHHLPLVASDVLNIRVWRTTAGANYKLKINTEQFASTNLNATLEDLFTNSRTPLNLEGTAVEYPFTVTNDALSTGDRFRIVFQNAVLGTINPTATGFSIVPNPVIGDSFQVNLGTLATGKYSYSICNAIGQEVEKGSFQNATQNTNYTIKFRESAATGIYIMKIKGSDNTVITAKLIKK